MMTLIFEQHIVQTKGVRNGKPHIAGSRITVSDIVIWHFRLGQSLEEIASKYNLSMAAVYAAISYYFDNKSKIDAHIDSSRNHYEKHYQARTSILKEMLAQIQSDQAD